MINTNITNNENNKITNNSKYLPFNIQWLDSSYQQTCLSDSPWQKILNNLEPIVANRAREQFNNRQRRQILIELLGTQFQWKLFPMEPDIPYILIPPYMLEEDRHKLENEAKSWLQIQVFKAAVEIGATVTEDQDINQLSNDMKNFLEYTYEIVSKSFERYLYQIQYKEEIMKQEEKLQERNKIKNQNELFSHSKFRSILRDSQTNSKKLPIINELISASSHPMSSQYSDIISKSIIALLKCDLRRVIFIKEKLFGQQLPIILRQFIWTECLLRFEKKPFDNDLSFVEFQIRRDFATGVTRGKNELKLKSPLNTPVTNLIENAVIETYSKIHALHPYLEEQHLRFTIKILNVLYTYRKDYKSYFIYWLLPFQLSYNNNKNDGNKNEELYVIAMHLNLFIRHCFPQWSNIFSIANEIMVDLSINDQEFYQHLTSISNIRKKINPKDFIQEIISLENKQTSNPIQYTNDLISDPVIFLRKWISQMFVGILNCNSVLYLWDQFFMIKWNRIYIKYAIKAILYLLRNRFMYAIDYNDMRKIFLDEPYLLYTSNIQTAFVHLAIKNNDPKYIPDMNQRLYPSKLINNTRFITNKQKTYLETMGIKNISLSLIIPMSQNFQQEFQYKSLIVEIQVYEDTEILKIISTKSVPIIQEKQQSMYKWQKITIDIPNEKLIISIQQTRQSFIPTRIQALVLIHQRLDTVTLKTLGYCRFPLYIPQKIGNLDTWEVTFGPVKRALHSGIPPPSIDMISDIPKPSVANTIGPGSSISLVIFDPKTEQYSHLI
ncbi:unnamed protein product [Rotaria sordida]|nr:unnamed protein product [Rotaria sordida]